MAAALYFDENVDIELALRLRADGYDVLTTREAGLLGSTDEQPRLRGSRRGASSSPMTVETSLP